MVARSSVRVKISRLILSKPTRERHPKCSRVGDTEGLEETLALAVDAGADGSIERSDETRQDSRARRPRVVVDFSVTPLQDPAMIWIQ